MNYTVTKSYRDLPAAHRQPNHEGHCRFIHGHNWGFDITFSCSRLDENGFVIDVGSLRQVKEWFSLHFDHTLLLNADDPYLGWFKGDIARITIVQNCGMEGLAKAVYDWVNNWLAVSGYRDRIVIVTKVVCWEDSKNSATYEYEAPIP